MFNRKKLRKMCLSIGISVITLCIAIFSGCNIGDSSGIKVLAKNLRFSATPVGGVGTADFESMYSFYDDDYYYYAFYLGRIDHVPLQDICPTYEYKGNRFAKEITTTETTSRTITNMITQASTQCVSYSLSTSINGTIGNDQTKQKLEAGLSQVVSSSYTVSYSESISKAETYSKTVSDTTKFEFDKGTDLGFYRYVLFGDIDVFGVIIKDVVEGTYYKETYEIIASQYHSLDFSTKSTFDDNNYEKLVFEIDENKLKNLPSPATYIGDITTWEWKYDNTTEKKIDASYTYTDIDCFNFDEYTKNHDFRKYMTKEYIFNFNIKLLMKEDYEGYQEISLCNANGEVVASVGDNFSYKGGEKGSKGIQELNFEVSGDKCTHQMHMEYGAHGNFSDDWHRYECHVVVTISKKH